MGLGMVWGWIWVGSGRDLGLDLKIRSLWLKIIVGLSRRDRVCIPFHCQRLLGRSMALAKTQMEIIATDMQKHEVNGYR